MKVGAHSLAAGLVGLAILGGSAGALDAALRAVEAILVKKEIHPPGGTKLHTLGERSDGSSVRFGAFELAPAQPMRMSEEGMDELGTHNYVSQIYLERGGDGPPTSFELHCAYYTGMLDQVPHVPERCLVGAGWLPAGRSRVVPVELAFDERGLDPDAFVPAFGVDESAYGRVWAGRCPEVSRRVRLPMNIEELRLMVTPFIDPAGNRVYAGYFFVANGSVYASAEDLRLKAIKLQDEYAYFMKVQFTSRDVDSPEGLAAVAGRFLDEALPSLMRRTPDWIDVVEGRLPEPSS